MSDEHWFEDETGPMVRPYAVTGGRTRPSTRLTLDLMACVTAVAADDVPAVDHARARVLALLRGGSRPVVELAADADMPLTVVRVLLGDLAEAGLVRVDPPRRAPVGPHADPELLREIAARLREL
ncbi:MULTISPECIES: DUF742 domain-containing protein [unclassified Streptomyces]|uniref:DUF742 domain-containing protein n=1 Tax=unclassified Streptomyces TaxID=2593676 RepID=UPI001F04BEFA|nr:MULTISPECIES: DUF742 domain-containing protein [unclassified Streptomyces]